MVKFPLKTLKVGKILVEIEAWLIFEFSPLIFWQITSERLIDDQWPAISFRGFLLSQAMETKATTLANNHGVFLIPNEDRT